MIAAGASRARVRARASVATGRLVFVPSPDRPTAWLRRGAAGGAHVLPAYKAGLQMSGKRIRALVLVVLAIAVAVIWITPLYWAVSLSVRPPSQTFTVGGLAVPFLQFQPTAENWRTELLSQ